MKKIISVFQRNYDTDRLIRDEVVPGAEWVVAGEGIATRKYDGACCLIRDGKLFKRYELKRDKVAPPGFEPAQAPDATTGDTPGWLPVGDGPEDKWFREARDGYLAVSNLPGGTYEAIGPHFGGGHHSKNPEELLRDNLIPHGCVMLDDCPRDFAGLRDYLAQPDNDIEGVVFHHPDGRMAKVKKKDFGLKRKPAAPAVATPEAKAGDAT